MLLLLCWFQGLPQLAVLAKILCLLMVVMCGAVPSSVSSVSLYSTCSRGNVTVMKMVTSKKQNDHNAPYQRLTTKSHDPFVAGRPLTIYIYAEAAEKYVCFNKRGRVVAKKKRDEMCQFHEVYSGRYLRYVSAIDPTRYLGFNKVGKSIPWPRGSAKCYNFLKMYPKAGVQNHHNKQQPNNNKPHHHLQHQKEQQHHQQQRLRSLSTSSSSSSLSSSSSSSSLSPSSSSVSSSSHPKSLQRSSNSLLHHQERTRHRHGWRRRQHLRQQQQQQQRHHQLQQHVMRPYQESKY